MRPYRRKTLAAGVPLNGKQKLLSFGAYPAVSLKDARAQRDEAKELLAKGIDPGEEKKERKAAQAAKEDVASGLTEALQPVRNTSLAPGLKNCGRGTGMLRRGSQGYVHSNKTPKGGNAGP
nr:integrase arm-type DNA-binding domain-containing protein [Candidatus Desulfovibrio trichonymphae]